MSVLVTTVDGYHIFTSSGKHLTSLEGHRVESFAPGPDGTWLAIVDRREIWQHGADGTWTPLAKSRRRPHRRSSRSAAPCSRAPSDARVLLRLDDGGLVEPLAAFDTVAGPRRRGTRSASPLQRAVDDRDLPTAACCSSNVHVGGIPRSADGGATVEPDDRGRRRRAPGPRAPDRVRDRGRRGVGRAVPRATTAARRGRSTTDGMEMSYAARRRHRRRRRAGDGLRRPAGPTRSADLPRVRSTAARSSKVDRRLARVPRRQRRHRCIASDGTKVALVDGDGDVWRRPTGMRRVAVRIAEGIAGVTGVAIA